MTLFVTMTTTVATFNVYLHDAYEIFPESNVEHQSRPTALNERGIPMPGRNIAVETKDKACVLSTKLN